MRWSKPSMARKINRIIVHTSASYNSQKGVLDPSASDIDAMHRARGWKSIGYHAVIRRGGQIEEGRDEDLLGAGVAWANGDTLHVCCTGHGDYEDFTPQQKESLCLQVYHWMKQFGMLPAFRKNPFRILGHNEINVLVAKGVYEPRARTTKSCPGSKVDMGEIRTMIYLYCKEKEGW